MYADRDRYVGDPAFVNVPVAGLLDPAYVAERARADRRDCRPAAAAGVPPGAPVAGTTARSSRPAPRTSSSATRDGNVVSMTTTVESIFGTGRMVDGFFLNNQLTDFSFAPADDAGPAGRQRGRAGQAPAIVDGAVDPADPRRPFRRGDRLGRGQCDPRLCRQVDGRGDRLEPADAAGAAAPNLVARGTNFNGEVTKFSPEVLDGAARSAGST